MVRKRSASNQEQEECPAKKAKKVKAITFDGVLTVFRNGKIEDFQEIIDLGSLRDINMRNKEGETLLMTQCMNGCLLAVKFLLDSGADANLTDNTGNTVLCLACRLNYFPITKLLIEYGANINATDSEGNSAFALACRLYKITTSK